MTIQSYAKIAGAVVTLVAMILAAVSIKAPRAHADDDDSNSKVQIGFAIAPVLLNMDGKDPDLVGLGSYIVNSYDCNGCHSMGPATEFTGPGNPYLLPPPGGPFSGKKQVNPATYLGGGRDFGPFPGLQHLYSRNLTPDKSGRAEGGHTFQEFRTIMRTGKDYDHLHPTCIGAPNGACVPAPFNGHVLQVMPWPAFQSITDHELRAIYEYLSAIPCIDTVVNGAPILRNDCGQ